MIEPPPSDGIHYNPANNSADLNGNTGTGNSVNSGNGNGSSKYRDCSDAILQNWLLELGSSVASFAQFYTNTSSSNSLAALPKAYSLKSVWGPEDTLISHALLGHPSGLPFSSPSHFSPHLIWLFKLSSVTTFRKKNYTSCECSLCPMYIAKLEFLYTQSISLSLFTPDLVSLVLPPVYFRVGEVVWYCETNKDTPDQVGYWPCIIVKRQRKHTLIDTNVSTTTNNDDISGVEYRIQLLVSNLVATVRGDLLHPYLQWPLQCQCIPTKSQEEFREANELAMRISSEIQVWNPHETQVNLFNYNFSLQVPSPSLSHLFETYEFRCFRFGSEVIRVGDYIRIRSNKFNHKYMDPNTNLTIMHIHKIIDISDLVKAEMLVIIGRVYQRQQTFSVTIDTDLLMPAWIPVSPNGLDQDLFVIQFDDIIGRYYPVKSALVNFKKGSLKKRDWRMWSDVDDDCTAAMGINFENDFIVDDENVLIEDDSDLGITIDSGIILKSFFDEHSNIQELNKTDQEDTKPDNQLEKQVKGEKPQEILMSSIPLISSLVSQFFDLTQPLISNDSLRKILYAREQNRNVQTKMLASHHIILKDFLTRMSKHDFSKLFMFELTIISQLFHLGLTDFEEPISIGTMMTDLGVRVDQCVYKNPVEFGKQSILLFRQWFRATKNHQRLFDIGTVFSHFWFEEWTSLRFSLDKITQASGYTTVLRHIDVQKSLIKKQHVSLEDLPTEIVEWLKMDHIDSTKSVHTSKRSLNQTLNRVTVKRVCLPPTYRQLGPGINSRIDNDQVSLVKVLSLPFRKAFSAFDHFIEDLEFKYNDNDTETVLDYKPGNDYQLEKSAQSFPIPSIPIATGVKFVQGKIHWVGHLGYDSEGRLRTASETPCELNLYLYTSINGKSKKCTLSNKFTNHFQKYSEFQIIKLTKDSRIKKKTLQYVENNEFKNPMTMNDEINTSPLLFQAKPAVLHDVQYLKLRDMMTDSVVAIWRNKYYEGVLFSGTNLFYMVATVGRLSIQKLYPDLIYT